MPAGYCIPTCTRCSPVLWPASPIATVWCFTDPLLERRIARKVRVDYLTSTHPVRPNRSCAQDIRPLSDARYKKRGLAMELAKNFAEPTSNLQSIPHREPIDHE